MTSKNDGLPGHVSTTQKSYILKIQSDIRSKSAATNNGLLANFVGALMGTFQNFRFFKEFMDFSKKRTKLMIVKVAPSQ